MLTKSECQELHIRKTCPILLLSNVNEVSKCQWLLSEGIPYITQPIHHSSLIEAVNLAFNLEDPFLNSFQPSFPDLGSQQEKSSESKSSDFLGIALSPHPATLNKDECVISITSPQPSPTHVMSTSPDASSSTTLLPNFSETQLTSRAFTQSDPRLAQPDPRFTQDQSKAETLHRWNSNGEGIELGHSPLKSGSDPSSKK
jgi:hypothetical protein